MEEKLKEGYPEEWQGYCKKHKEPQPCWDCCDEYLKEE